MNRAEWDALTQRRLAAMTEALPADDPATSAERRYATEEIQLTEAQARTFADAVDRSGKTIDYADAVVVSGGAGEVVCTLADWKANRAYWEQVAAGASGEVEWAQAGADLLSFLTTGEPVTYPLVS